ncbi:AMP-dependent synthetase/ligase [Simplicispira suum]|uniref:Acyl-CoA synthetase n=1 Tax=Simplicispira suum TaxID=2109915 RepID=A0A2S0N2L3_9BURK|nr:AMP-binding protein [Simplicispira suum]AVO42389.1 acyl-CoA synthetase [Simplicispira suum]
MMPLATLPQLLMENARVRPTEAAQRQKKRGIWREYTWAEVASQVLSVASAFERFGVGQDDSVLVVGDNEPEHVWAQLAVQCVGARAVSLYPDISGAELEHVAADSGARFAVAQGQEQIDKLLTCKLEKPLRKLVYWKQDGMWSYSDDRLVNFFDLTAGGDIGETVKARIERGTPDDIACLAYTSGTTSMPKGVICSHRYLLDNAARLQAAVQLQPGDSYLSYTPFAWATEQYLGVALAVALPLVVHFPERPDQVPEAIREIAPHFLVFGSRQWEALASQVRTRMLDAGPLRQRFFNSVLDLADQLEARRRDGKAKFTDEFLRRCLDYVAIHGVRDQLGLTRVRTALLGGSAMAPEAFAFFHALRVPLRNAYGCSEYGVVMGHVGHEVRVESIGALLPVEEQFGPKLEAQVSASGELEIRGGSGFSGYWNAPEKTAEKWRDGWFQTGDVVSRNGDDFIYIDRVQDMRTLSEGSTFSPQFLEVRLRFSPYVKDVLVIGDESRPFVVALINIDGAALSQWAESQKISFGGYPDLSQHPRVVELIGAEIGKVNGLLPASAQIRRFANFPKELDPDEGELTRTRKLKREVVQARYGKLIDALYDGGTSHHLSIDVTLQDGRKGIFAWDVTLRDAGASINKHKTSAARRDEVTT